MESKSLEDMHQAPYNPRIFKEHDFASLKEAIRRFGDLSGVVVNLETGNIVGGNHRIKAFQQIEGAQIKITERLESATKTGTVATGYITANGESYAYREVRWPLEIEKAANIAANRIHGDWDEDKLAEVMHGLDEDLRKATGHTNEEIEKLLDSVSDVGKQTKYSVLIECSGIDHQNQIMGELAGQGYTVKALTK